MDTSNIVLLAVFLVVFTASGIVAWICWTFSSEIREMERSERTPDWYEQQRPADVKLRRLRDVSGTARVLFGVCLMIAGGLLGWWLTLAAGGRGWFVLGGLVGGGLLANWLDDRFNM